MMLAVPVQDSWTVGQTVSSAAMNKNVRDAVTFLANPPIFAGQQSVAQSIPNGAFTSVLFDQETLDSYNGHSTSVNTSRYVAQVSGQYQVTAMISWTANTAGFRSHLLLVNGVASLSNSRNDFNPGASTNTATITYTTVLNAGDYIEVQVEQTSGAALALARAVMTVQWVHA